MILPSEFYEKKLYPLQDGVLKTVDRAGTNFFLTGGTALSRAYYNHRYSEDLDFFISSSPDYDDSLNKILDMLHEDGFVWNVERDYIRNKYFASIKVGYSESEMILKLDFVNDTVPHFGSFNETSLFKRTDSIRNILSNKLSAIFRYAAKDISDIREIALHEKINWPEIIMEARQKEGGLELIYISDILKGIPKSEFETIAWTKKPDWEVFQDDINRIVYDMVSCGG